MLGQVVATFDKEHVYNCKKSYILRLTEPLICTTLYEELTV